MSVAVQRPPPISLPKLSEGLPTIQYDEIISPDHSHSFSSTSFTNNTSVRSNWDVQDSKLKMGYNLLCSDFRAGSMFLGEAMNNCVSRLNLSLF